MHHETPNNRSCHGRDPHAPACPAHLSCPPLTPLPSPHLAIWQGYTKPGEMMASTGLDSARHSDGDDDSDTLLMEAGSRMAPFQIMHTRSATKDSAYA